MRCVSKTVGRHACHTCGRHSIGRQLRHGQTAGVEETLAIREKQLGPEHPDTVNSLNNLAALLKAKGAL